MEVVKENKNAFDQAYDSGVIDRPVRTLAAIEARIDKAYARILNLKEYRRLEESRKPTPIPSPSITPTSDFEAEQDAVDGQDEDEAKTAGQ